MTGAGVLQHMGDVLASSARRFAGKPAVCFLGDGRTITESVTFAALHAQARALAASLARRCTPGARVMLMLPSQLDYVRAFCGCLYAGLCAVPLYPPASHRQSQLDRVRNVVLDARPALILGEAEMQETLRAWIAAQGIDGCQVATVAQVLAEGGGAEGWQAPRLDGSSVAFLQYTSGSTGTPKGVVVRHGNLLANLRAMQEAFGITAQDRMVSWLPLFHDMGLIGAVLEPIYSGVTCYLMATETFAGAPWSWLEALSRYRGTISFAPNAAYGLCARMATAKRVARLDLGCWTHAINGAEPIHPATMAAFCRCLAPAGFRPSALSPGYGQAEATLCASITPRGQEPAVVRLDRAALERGKVALARDGAGTMELMTCGYPLAGHRMVIVDAHTRRRCADDEIGEVWLAGPSNADTYWQNQEASDETLRARLPGDDTRYVRSGDLGFFYEGQLVICGRLKDLIILNGQNIYPHDVERAIVDAVPSIRAGRLAAFSVVAEDAGQERLALAAEVRRRPAAEAAASLYARMRQAALDAAGCAIDHIVLIEQGTIPMTTSGKISRRGARQCFLDGTLHVIARSEAWAEPAGDPGAAGPVTLAPVTLAPVTLADVRARVARGEAADVACLVYLQHQLQRVRPGAAMRAAASLIELGLDSIAIAMLRGVLMQELGWAPAVADLFGSRPLAALAADMAGMLGEAQSDAAAIERGRPAPARPAPGAEQPTRAPLSYAQQRLWFLHALAPERCQHNITVRVRLRGPLDGQALAQSLADLIERHAILRTRYRNGPAGAEQVIAAASGFRLRQHDLCALPAAAQDQAIEDRTQAERRTPFALETGPVLRAHLFACAPEAHELLLCLHHIAFDGRSAEVFLDELGRLYDACSRGEAAQLAALPLQYGDFARWEQARVDGAFVRRQLAFWRAYLAEVPAALPLGTAGAASAASAASAAEAGSPGVHAFPLDQALCRALERHARAANLTLFMLLLAAHAVVLRHFTRQERFLVGTDVSGRWLPESEGLIGFFVNQLAIRCDLAGDPSLRALLARQRQDALDAYAHQELPFDVVVSALAPARSSRRAPLFQVKLNYQPSRTETGTLGAARVDQVQVHQERGDFDVVLDLVHGSHGIDAALAHDSAALGPLFAARLQRLWLRLLGELETWLDQPLSALLERMQQWDAAVQAELGQVEATRARAGLGRIARQTFHVRAAPVQAGGSSGEPT